MDALSILVLEDDPAHSEAIRRAFDSAEPAVEIRVASSFQEYCGQVADRQPDIALLDLNLPDGGSQEGLALLPDSDAFPALVMTSSGNEKVAVAAMKAGALDYLVKSPETFANMPDTVRRIMREWKLMQAHKQSEAELLNLRAAVEQSANTFIITDTKGVIEYVNPAFEKNTGYTAAEVIGQTPHILKSGEQDREFYRNLWETIASGKTWRGQFHNRRKDGSLSWESAMISPVLNAHGEIVRFIGVQEDINELKHMEASLREALDRAEEATLAKSEFLANMSHEIRTPINGIIGMTDLLLETPQTPEQHEFAETIRSCGDSLLSIINDILDFSKVEAGQLQLESLDFDIRTTVEDTLEILATKAQQKGIDAVSIVAEEVPEILRGDPGRLRQILFNLVGNAIKFTHHGGVTVQVDLLEETDASATLRFRVTDTGIGIPQDRQEAIFSKFTQADASTARQFGGTGLGLAISRQLIHLFQGEITVTSEEGRGSTFSFTAVFGKPATGTIRPTPKEADLSGVKVLVADDFETNRILMTNLLKRWGCRYHDAPDAATALALLKRAAEEGDPFSVALLDMQMPGVDGAELGRQIKGDDEIRTTRLVMLTSLGKRGDAERLSGVGFSGYLPKPIRPALLRKCLALVLGREEPVGSDHLLITRHTVAETARKRLRILVAEDNTTNRIIAVKMLEKLGHLAESVANGEEVIDSLRRIPYDLVLMDCQMPVLDGFAATKMIRESGSGVINPRVPIIALTAHAMKGDRDYCLKAGMNDYVSKPTSTHDLAAAIDRCISGLSRLGDAVPAAENPPGNPGARDFDREGFLERTMGDQSLVREMVEAFLADSPMLLDGISAAISAGDARAAGRCAHTLKGSSANMGGEILSQIAEQMQSAGKENNLPRLAELFPKAKAAFQILSAKLEQAFQSDPLAA